LHTYFLLIAYQTEVGVSLRSLRCRRNDVFADY